VQQCTDTRDAVCANCSVCSDDDPSYEAAECNATHDTVCSPCPNVQCLEGLTFRAMSGPSAYICGPEAAPPFDGCVNCTRCATPPWRACEVTRDAVCALHLGLTFLSELPASAFTERMRSALGDALAAALDTTGRVGAEVSPPYADATARRRTLALQQRLRVDVRLVLRTPDHNPNGGSAVSLTHAAIEQKVLALDRVALARASGLPITLLFATMTRLDPKADEQEEAVMWLMMAPSTPLQTTPVGLSHDSQNNSNSHSNSTSQSPSAKTGTPTDRTLVLIVGFGVFLGALGCLCLGRAAHAAAEWAWPRLLSLFTQSSASSPAAVHNTHPHYFYC
jgi:hypothetical protein